MRKWAYLEKPYEYMGQEIFKVMVYETAKEGVYVFLYDSPEAQICVADEWYESVSAATGKWDNYVKHWNVIGDPLLNCQDDCILPIRIKGRNVGKPEWGAYEVLVDGNWIEYKE